MSFWSHVSSVSINTATTQLLSKAQKPMVYMFPQWKYQDKEIHQKTRPASWCIYQCTCPARGYCNANSSSAFIFASINYRKITYKANEKINFTNCPPQLKQSKKVDFAYTLHIKIAHVSGMQPQHIWKQILKIKIQYSGTKVCMLVCPEKMNVNRIDTFTYTLSWKFTILK